MVVIKVEDLGKKYIISHQAREPYVALRDVIAGGIKGLWPTLIRQGSRHSEREEFWALKNVSFEVERGDRLGIIGANGAGKSTLLKLLSRITEPSTGRITLRGNVASLLEVGTGFHPELTGRENIFLNGATLGMSKREIKRKFDTIVEFAEVEKFLDTPVKRYSSGMFVRLAFAVAAHLEPEIMVVDEVLAVGDAKFQKKCLGKMENISQAEGRTILFVSHDMGAIKKLCQRCIVLDHGGIVFQGETQQAVNFYLNVAKDQATAKGLKWRAPESKKYPFSELIRILGLSIRDEKDEKYSDILFNSKSYKAAIDIELIKPDPNIIIALAYHSLDGRLLFINNLVDTKEIKIDELKPGRYRLTSRIPVEFFANGACYLEILCVVHTAGWLLSTGNESRIRIEFFRDINHTTEIALDRPQPLMPLFKWSLQHIG